MQTLSQFQLVQKWHSSWLGPKGYEGSHGVEHRPFVVLAPKDLRCKGEPCGYIPTAGLLPQEATVTEK